MICVYSGSLGTFHFQDGMSTRNQVCALIATESRKLFPVAEKLERPSKRLKISCNLAQVDDLFFLVTKTPPSLDAVAKGLLLMTPLIRNPLSFQCVVMRGAEKQYRGWRDSGPGDVPLLVPSASKHTPSFS